MKKHFLLFLLLTSVIATCQTVSPFPHPYGEVSFNLMPSGYASTAFGFGGGVMLDSKHFIFDSFLGYDTGHKENDATSNNNKGHDRFLRGFASYKQGANYVGIGARWSQLSTTNYTKGGPVYSAGSWHPELGAGRDFSYLSKNSPLFMRAQVAYMFKESKEYVHYPNGVACQGCGNGSNGADISIWFPSPERAGHIFFKINAVIYQFHDTITDPSNKNLTDLQIANKHWADSTEFKLLFRF